MLEAKARDGHGRLLDWQPDGKTATLPGLIVPETSIAAVPDWAEVVLTGSPSDREAIELVSDGTWFHPSGAQAPLLVAAPQPGTSDQVQVLDVGGEVAVFHDAGGWASDPRRLVPAFIEAKQEAGSRAFWAPALGHPADYAVWAWLGVDLFDASPLLLAATRGEALSTNGTHTIADMEAVHGGIWDLERLIEHNLDAAREELSRIRHAIANGTLRALAERRCYARPHSVEVLRRADHEHKFQEMAAPAASDKPVPCMTHESLWSPVVERFRQRLGEYTPPAGADTLVLLPCSARKPYRLSQSHRYFARVLDDSGMRHRVHEVMITSPLGVVPRELEDSYPANRYDVPVTGHWNRDEEAIIRAQLAALLDAHEYKHIVAHVSPSTYTFLRNLLPDGTLHTGHGHSVQSKADCDRLRDTLRKIKDDDPQPNNPQVWSQRKLQDLQAIASFQFGAAAAAALCEGSKAHGKVPFVKLDQNGVRLGMTTIDRGLLSLTIDGADIVAKHGTKRVFTEDFWPKKTGSLFAVGVTHTDPDVRTGDDVVVMFGDEVRACGQALMPGHEMTGMKRGVAVSLRHVRKPEAN